MKKTYQIPTLNLHQLSAECLLFVGTTIEVDPGDSGSQADAESKKGTFEDIDKSLNSFEHNPLDYLPSVFNDPWE
jgi:hypothetical protein